MLPPQILHFPSAVLKLQDRVELDADILPLHLIFLNQLFRRLPDFFDTLVLVPRPPRAVVPAPARTAPVPRLDTVRPWLYFDGLVYLNEESGLLILRMLMNFKRLFVFSFFKNLLIFLKGSMFDFRFLLGDFLRVIFKMGYFLREILDVRFVRFFSKKLML